MEILQGVGASAGLAVGKIKFWLPEIYNTAYHKVDDPDEEIDRFNRAKHQAVAQLTQLYEKTASTLGEEQALLFNIHQMMMEDEDFVGAVFDAIKNESANAEYAVQKSTDAQAGVLVVTKDPYMMDRVADVHDICRRLLRILSGKTETAIALDEACIVAAADLTPSDTAQLDRGKVLAVLTAKGSANSHTAIFARVLGIPAVVNLGDSIHAGVDGLTVCVDGADGTVCLDPDKETLDDFETRHAALRQDKERLQEFFGKQTKTKDGRRIEIHANIGSTDDLERVIANDAEGIGLFRSEFLFLGRDIAPTEEEQFRAYKKAAEKMAGKRVTIRTLDIGADKHVDYLNVSKEENPALGLRGIRLCLEYPEIFTTQLRAILRASAFGRIAVMFPMVNSVNDVRRAKQFLESVKRQLDDSGVAFDRQMEVGVMIETPAAALISESLAQHVDFFSIGTNDLTQYTLAADRQNQSLAQYCDPYHEAVVRLIEITVQNAHDHGAWVGVCGELGADPKMTKWFVENDIDELSVAPSDVLMLRSIIAEM